MLIETTAPVTKPDNSPKAQQRRMLEQLIAAKRATLKKVKDEARKAEIIEEIKNLEGAL